MKTKIVLATRNEGKRREIERLLGDKYSLLMLNEIGFYDEIDEAGSTFEENAIIKATTVSQRLNMPVIAEDSGLEVNALTGRPGVMSARFAGWHGDDKANNALLLDKLRDVPAPRKARFVCVAALAYNGNMITTRGECEGEIGFFEDGENGFGYDPLFVYKGESFGKMDVKRKNAISHRAEAFRRLSESMGDLQIFCNERISPFGEKGIKKR